MLTIERSTELNGGADTVVGIRPALMRSLSRYFPYLLFGLCASLYLLPFMRFLFRETDEGILVEGAVRTLQGQMLGRDFFEVLGPGTFYWLALFFKVFGVTFFASRICLFVSSLGTALSLYFLSRRVCRSYQLLPCILVFATYFGTLWPEISHHTDSNFFALLAVVCMIVWRESRNNWLLVAAGALAGATTLTLQPKGMLLLLAFLVWLGIQRWQQSTPLSALFWITGGYVATVAAMLAYFWSRGALHDLIYANLVFPYKVYGPTYSVPYAFLLSECFKHWIVPMHGINWTIGMAAVCFIPFLFVAALPVILLCLGVRRGIRHLRAEIVLYWLAGSAIWLSEIHRKDIVHLVFGSPLLIVLCVFYLQDRMNKSLHVTLQVISIASVCLAGVTLIISSIAQPMQTRAGLVHTSAYNQALDAIAEHVAPGGEMFVFPYAPMDYFLTATRNPTRYSTLTFNVKVGSQFVFDEVEGDLDRHRVRYVLWDRDLAEKRLGELFPSRHLDSTLFEIYLESHYRQIWAHDGVFLMERKNDQPSN